MPVRLGDSGSVIHNHGNIKREDASCVRHLSDVDVQDNAVILAYTCGDGDQYTTDE